MNLIKESRVTQMQILEKFFFQTDSGLLVSAFTVPPLVWAGDTGMPHTNIDIIGSTGLFILIDFFTLFNIAKPSSKCLVVKGPDDKV